MIERLHHVKPVGMVAINPKDGKRFGLEHGDIARITTPGSIEAQVSVLPGVMSGVIAMEHGYGHKELVHVNTGLMVNLWRLSRL